MRVRTATSLRARLREGTAELHRAVEARLALGERDLTLDRYRDVLAALHGFYEPLEQRLAAVAAARPLGLMLRRRAPLLADDLAWLGLSHDAIARLPRCTQLPCVDDAGDAAGCLYVVEGAALGGRVVTRALQARLGTTAERGGRFFAEHERGGLLQVLRRPKVAGRGLHDGDDAARLVEICGALNVARFSHEQTEARA
jgi:heme oxygenase